MTHVTAGGIAGAVAAAVTTPLDVCKTLLQTRGLSDDAAIRNARGLGDAFRIIYSRHGLAGFARGMTPRVLTNMPSNALCCASSSLSSLSLLVGRTERRMLMLVVLCRAVLRGLPLLPQGRAQQAAAARRRRQPLIPPSPPSPSASLVACPAPP